MAERNPRAFTPAESLMGRLEISASVDHLKHTPWDVIVVGAGHNGMTCAAYLALGGRRVLVLESRDRVGGACTIHEAFPGVRLSPCAYLLGLLHPLVIEELNLTENGLKFLPATAGLFVPFEDGTSIQLWDDDRRCEEEIRRFSPRDVAGWLTFNRLKSRVRDALRPPDDRDVWIGKAPSRAQIEHRVRRDPEAIGLLFEWSMAQLLERYFQDPRLQQAYMGQGVIGTNASPFDPGTASIHFHHQSGRLGGVPGQWGYVVGGMGMVSMILCNVARASGVEVAVGMPVARIIPGEGVELAGGDSIDAPVVVSNADPVTTLELLDSEADPAWRARVEAIPMRGCTLKLNVVLNELPNFVARPGTAQPHHSGQINTPLTADEWRDGFQEARAGRLPARLWSELYFQTVHDPSIAPPGTHTMSVFAQYVPYQFESGTWDDHRDAAVRRALDSVARFCSNLPRAITDVQAYGPPDIERVVGLHGGHIFQGECLPPYMWDQRLDCATPMPGVYLCGAGTHPGGSVIGVNGRNAAMRILEET